MRVAFIGVGHWHTPLYLEPLLQLPDVRVVGVSDPAPSVAERCGTRLGCSWSIDATELVERSRPDLVFVLGRHADMAGQVDLLIRHGVPFVVEKPAGLTEHEVRRLAEAAAAGAVFNAVPLVFRSSGFMAAIRERAAGEALLYADFKFVAGLPQRYHQSGCEWVFDRGQSGGGCLMNLGVHFIDLFQCLTTVGETRLTGTEFANLQGNGDTEDYVSLTLRNQGRIGRIETAYLYPAPIGVFDLHFSARTEAHYFKTTGPGLVEVSDMSGARTTIEATTTNMPIYPTFVADIVRQVRAGTPPIAGLADMANILHIVDQAYSSLTREEA